MGQYKQGLDYFPFTIGLLKDRKLRRPKLKFGCVVNDIYLSLLELIYGDKGYYIKYSKETKDDVIWEILENLQGKYCPNAETVEQVIEELVACELFSGDHFNTEILTSKRIQQTYYSATVERKAVDVDFDIWFLSEEEMKKLSSNSLILAKFLNRSNDEANRSNDEANRSNERERKVRKSTISNDIVKKVSKKEIYKKESSNYENFDPDSTEPPMRKDGSYDFDYFKKHRSHKSIMDEFRITGYYRKTLEEFLRYCYANGHTVMNQTLDNLICRLDEYYGQDDVEKIKSLERAMQNGYYDIKELKR